MNEVTSIREKIDRLFEAEAEVHPDQLRAFVDRLHTRYDASVRSMVKRGSAILFVWLLSVLLASGLVEEGAIGSFKLVQLQSLLVLAPAAVGLVSNRYYASMLMATLIWAALDRAYKHLLPKVFELDLEYLLAPPIFLDIVRSLQPSAERRLARNLHTWFSLPVFVGPFIVLVHVSYLLLLLHQWHVAISIAATVVGAFWMVKGWVLIGFSALGLGHKADSQKHVEPQITTGSSAPRSSGADP